MPGYKHLAHRGAALDDIAEHMKALRMVGVPYTDEMIKNARFDAYAQAADESDYHEGLETRYPKAVYRNFDGQVTTTEMDALLAYLQILGTLAELRDYHPAPATTEASND